jgi:hypothetical protein
VLKVLLTSNASQLLVKTAIESDDRRSEEWSDGLVTSDEEASAQAKQDDSCCE